MNNDFDRPIKLSVDRRSFLSGSVSAFTLIASAGCAPDSGAPAPAKIPAVPPQTPKRPVRIEKFGRVRYDDYAWLKHPGWFQSIGNPSALDPEIRAHLEAENAYCDAVLEGTQEFQADLFRELEARDGEDELAPPTADGPWAYYARVKPGSDYRVYLRRARDGGAEQILLDAGAEAEGKSYYRITSMRAPHASPDHRYFAWMADDAGDERYKLRIRDLKTGALVGDVIDGGYGQFEFSTDSRWIYWVHRDAMSRPVRVLRRLVTGGPSETVIEEDDPAFFLGLGLTASKAYLLIRNNTADSSEVRFVKDGAPPRLFEPRTAGLIYSVEHWRDRFVILTNADAAIDFKVMTAPEDEPERNAWRDLIPHRKGRHITSIRPFRDCLARVEWIDARPAIAILNGDGSETIVKGRDAAYDLSLDRQDIEYDTGAIRYVYSSPVTPNEWRSYDAATAADTLLKKQEASWFDDKRYQVKRLEAKTPDGAMAPITLLAPAGPSPAGARPLLLFTYGAYGSSMRATFSPAHLSMVDRGWAVALAHVRGGSERGRSWHLQSLATQKRNTITDYIACADHLIEQGHARAGRIIGHSFSAGGIPIGGAINMRPDLWAGVIARVPFVDVLNSIHDETNPLLYIEHPEWGDPADEDVFDYVAGYSPYENVRSQAYPAVLATAGLLDDRVGYWEAAKWIARLRELSTSGKPAMLKTYMEAGHQGPTGRSAGLRQLALFFAFAAWAVEQASNSATAR